MAGLNAGALDREVTIQQKTTAASGYPVETWTPLEAGVWMSKQDMRGKERFAAAQVSASYDTRWELQWRDDMDPDAIDVPNLRRLVYRGRVHDITAAMELGRQEGIALFTLVNPGAPTE
ncbi:MAG TPA: phage head closure protein [Vicinamibacterales bacterium]